MSKFTHFGLFFILSLCALLSIGHCWTFSLPHHRLFGQHHNDVKNAAGDGNAWLDKSDEEMIWPIDKVIMDNEADQLKDDKTNPEPSVPFLRISGSPWQRFKLGNRK